MNESSPTTLARSRRRRPADRARGCAEADFPRGTFLHFGDGSTDRTMSLSEASPFCRVGQHNQPAVSSLSVGGGKVGRETGLGNRPPRVSLRASSPPPSPRRVARPPPALQKGGQPAARK